MNQSVPSLRSGSAGMRGFLLLLVLAASAAIPARAQVLMRTRVTGAAAWNTASTWIQSRTGTLSYTPSGTTVNGSGTLFTTQLQAGDPLMLISAPGTVVGTVVTIVNDSVLTLAAAPAAGTSGSAFGRQALPGATDSVVIGNPALLTPAVTVTMTAPDTIGALTIAPGAVANSLVNNSQALHIGGSVTLQQPTAAVTSLWNIGAGAAYVGGSVTLASTVSSGTQIRRITVTTGTLDINGSLVYQQVTSGSATNAVVDMSGGAGTLYIGGSLILSGAGTGTLSPGSSSTVVYDGAGTGTVGDGSSIAYHHLRIAKPGTDTAYLGATCAVAGTFLVQSGVFNTRTISLTITGACTNNSTYVTTTGGLTVGGVFTNNGTYRSTSTGSLSISGASFNNNGTFVVPVGGTTPTLTFTGGLSQSINASSTSLTLNNLTINKTSGTSIAFGAGLDTIRARAFTLTQGIITVPPVLDLSSGVTLTAGTCNAGAHLFLMGTWSKATANTFNAGTGTVYLDGSSTQTLGGTGTTTFNNLNVVNTGTVTCSTSTNVTGTLTMVGSTSTMVPLAGVVFNSAAPAGTLTGAGTVRVTRTTATADFFSQYRFTTRNLVSLQVDYNATAAQTVNGATYSRLAVNGAAVRTASGALSVTTLTLASTATLDMGPYVLGGALTTLSSTGILRTADSSAAPLPSGKSWPYLVEYYRAAGGQTVMAGTYSRLTISNTGGTNTASGALSVTTALTLGTSSALSMSTHALSGTITTIAGTGTLLTANTTTLPLPAGRTWTGPVDYNRAAGGQTIVAGTYSTLTLTHTSGTTTVGGALVVEGGFSSTGAGIFADGGQAITARGSWTIDSTGGFLGTGTVTFAGSADQRVATPGSFKHITVSKPAGDVVLARTSVTLTGTLTFVLGRVRADTAVLYSTSGAIVDAGQSTGWVVGDLRLPFSSTKTADTFEVGCYLHYSPVALAFTSVGTAGTVTARSVDSLHPLIALSKLKPSNTVPRFWRLSGSGITYTSYTAAMRWAAVQNYSGYDSTRLSIALRGDTAWTLRPVTTGGASSAAGAGFTRFGELAVGDTCSVSASVVYTGSPYCYACGTASPTRTGPGGGTYSATPAGLSINAATGAVDLGLSTSGVYTVAYTIPADSGCGGSFAVTATLAIYDSLTWNGSVDSSWYVAANWTPARVPTAGSNVAIGCTGSMMEDTVIVIGPGSGLKTTAGGAVGPGGCGRIPVIDTGLAPVRNLTIDSPAAVLVRGAGWLRITGAKWGTGRIRAGEGSVEFKSTAAQSVPVVAFAGDSVRNLSINTAGGVTLGGPLRITGILKPTTGAFSTSTNLTLGSTAARTALIDGSGAGSVAGSVTVERYLAARRGYHYFSVPVTGATVGQFADEVSLTDTFARFYRYNEDLPHSGWVKDTSATSALVTGAGYALNFGDTSTPLTVDVQGPVVGGTVVFPLLANHNYTYTQGFNLVGNPYPSPVDWSDSAAWTRTAVDNAIYFFKAGTADAFSGTYSSWVAGVSSDSLASPIIAAMQGFFVHVTNGAYPVSGTLVVEPAARRTLPQPQFYRTASGAPGPLIRLTARYAEEEGGGTDAVAVYVGEGTTDAFEPEVDALKMMNTDARVPNLYAFASAGERLSISAVDEPRGTTRILPLGLQCTSGGVVEFRAQTVAGLPDGLHAYLADARSGTGYDLQRTPVYTASVEEGTSESRFFLVFSTESIFNLPATGAGELLAWASGSDITVFSGPAGGEVVVTDMMGRTVARQSVRGPGLHKLRVESPPGVHAVSLLGAEGRQSKKLLLGIL